MNYDFFPNFFKFSIRGHLIYENLFKICLNKIILN